MDRYWAITDPLAYPVIMTPGRAKKLIALVWACSSIISFPAIIWWRSVSSESDESDNQCNFTDDIGYLVFSSIISFYGPLSVMIYMYYRIYKAAVEQTRSIKAGLKHIETPGLHHQSAVSRTSDTTANPTSSNVQGFAGDSENGPVVLRIHRGGFTSLSAVLEQQQQHQQMLLKTQGKKSRSNNSRLKFWSNGHRKSNYNHCNTSMRNIAEAAATAAVAASAITASSEGNRKQQQHQGEIKKQDNDEIKQQISLSQSINDCSMVNSINCTQLKPSQKHYNQCTDEDEGESETIVTVTRDDEIVQEHDTRKKSKQINSSTSSCTVPIELGTHCSVKSSSSSTTSATSVHASGLKSPVQRIKKNNVSCYSDRSARSNLKTWSMGKKFSKLAKERKAAKTLGK